MRTTMCVRLAAAAALLFFWSVPAGATEICAWIKETVGADNEHDFELWLQSDSATDFLYQIGGEGIVTDSMTANSPGSATWTLEAGKAEKVWGYGATLDPPGKIDLSVELHQTPTDIFSDAPTPLLASFVFQRDVPASEKKPPATLAKKQCMTMKDVKS